MPTRCWAGPISNCITGGKDLLPRQMALATTSNTSSANRRISGSCSRAVDLHLSRYCNSAKKHPNSI
ncbi:hypothetical protein MRB53_017968 [Persea americana]|uniref:Uncharacterized protein n=1 Tax=Persea americana TaxID=3435 RepID=A0ACC2M6G8_PERAE|nr:hypothetical protein MRB53_017968 [Persea americana]